jgi:predicted Zn-dependent peptidase
LTAGGPEQLATWPHRVLLIRTPPGKWPVPADARYEATAEATVSEAVYYIDSAYRSDGRNGWATLSTGVDPDKLPAMRELLRTELARLVHEPPSQADLDEARRHLLGRQLSAAQSNRELADRLAREWLWYGEPTDYEDLRQRLERVTLQDLLSVLPAFTAGTIVAVRSPDH